MRTVDARLWDALSARDELAARSAVHDGADLDVADARGDTVLHAAIEQGETRMVRCLLSLGADPHMLNRQGRNAEALARHLGYRDILALLAQPSPQPSL